MSFENDKFIAAYNQNAEHFRSLNGLMWQIPLIAMTLTGGLWFGVSAVDENRGFQACLLLLAAVGNIGLMIALRRLRYIMGRYLEWFEEAYPEGHVAALGDSWATRSYLVQRTFQAVLALAAAFSVFLIGVTFRNEIAGALAGAAVMMGSFVSTSLPPRQTSLSSIAYYDERAVNLVHDYDAISFEAAHPPLLRLLKTTASLKVLDIGAGSGRDALWIADRGHNVTAVEPSQNLSMLARKRHGADRIRWINDTLPGLKRLNGGTYDLIILSAVWMHIAERDRAKAMARLQALLAPGGAIYVTLRLGHPDARRSIFPVSLDELRELSTAQGLDMQVFAQSVDLMERPEISWQSALLTAAPPADAQTAPQA